MQLNNECITIILNGLLLLIYTGNENDGDTSVVPVENSDLSKYSST